MDTSSQWLQEIYMEELGSTLPEHPEHPSNVRLGTISTNL